MRYGFVLPGGDARDAADLAVVAEESGWDGFFCFEQIWGVDAWMSLTAAAMGTRLIRLGTMLTPLPRRNPWDVASQVATLDNLSGGRVILTVGLGATDERWWMFEDDPGRRVRAERLDEGLTLMRRLWSGDPVRYDGRHYRARPTDRMLPAPPVQRPAPPIWVVGAWPRPRSMRRAGDQDGWLPYHLPASGEPGELTPEVLAAGVDWLRDHRAARGATGAYDVVVEGTTSPGDPAGAATVEGWRTAGATWWLEADWSLHADELRERSVARLRAGPPCP